jgi:hypothetical protein
MPELQAPAPAPSGPCVLWFRRHGREPWAELYRGDVAECRRRMDAQGRQVRHADFWLQQVAAGSKSSADFTEPADQSVASAKSADERIADCRARARDLARDLDELLHRLAELDAECAACCPEPTRPPLAA